MPRLVNAFENEIMNNVSIEKIKTIKKKWAVITKAYKLLRKIMWT